MKKLILIAVVVLLAIGVAVYLNDNKDDGNMASSLAPLYAYEWQLEQIDSESVDSEPQNVSDFVITFNSDNRFAATTDCNNLMGDYTVENGTELSFGTIASTRMACPEGDFQTEFTALLVGTESYSVAEADTDTPKLILNLSDDGTMTFVAIGQNIPEPNESEVETSTDLDDFVGMEEAEAIQYAAENDVMFRIGQRDGEFLPVTMDYRPGRVTASVDDGVVTGFTVE